MAYSQIDPSRLQGDALHRWYLRSHDEIEAERQRLAAERHDNFFGRQATPVAAPASNISNVQQSVQTTSPHAPKYAEQPASQWSSFGASGAGIAEPSFEPTYAANSTGFRNAAQPAAATSVRQTTSVGARQTKLPTQPQPSTFFSHMFGGPAPIKGSSGQTVGRYDHQAGRIGMAITGAYANIAQFFHPGDFMEGVFAAGAVGGVRATKALSKAIEEAVERHHADPRFLGGAANQKLVELTRSLHVDFHGKLAAALKEAGFPRVGGVNGSTKNWATYFAENAGRRERAYEILRRVTRDFDETNGTSISKYLDEALGLGDDAIK